MAFPAETITTAKMFIGPIIAAYTSGTLGRVISGKIQIKDEWLQITGGTIARAADMIQNGEGIELDLTMDEISDIDAATIRGKQAGFTLKQISASDATKMTLLTIPLCVITVTDIDMKASKELSTMTIHVKAYHTTAATAIYTFDNAASTA